MAENIRVEFTYNIPDEQYHQTNEKQLTADWVYEGPSHKWIAIRENAEGDDKPANTMLYTVPEEVAKEFNEDLSDGFYAVCVDCALEPEICLMIDGEDPTTRGTISEDLPDGKQYVRSHPPLLDHTYELRKIIYDREKGEFVKPFPWKTSDRSWDDLKRWRTKTLAATDKRVSEDMPESLKTAFLEYRTYLRDLPEKYGASWTITVDAGGANYAVGDVIEVSDSRLKNGAAVDNPIVTVSAVDSSGAITAIATSNISCYAHHPAAGTYTSLINVTNGSGTGVSLKATKIKTVDPWKVTPDEPPAQ